MRDGGIGRVLVAALHQSIADLLPSRLEFYENWFNPARLRAGRIGLAPLTAVLSFLRREGDNDYGRITSRAGEYAADWTIDGLSGIRRTMMRTLPRPLRARAALGIARDLVAETYSGSRGIVRMGRGGATVDIRGSIFCGVRDHAPAPLCGFYKAAFARVLARFDVPAATEITSCRGTGQTACYMSLRLTPLASGAAAPAVGVDAASELAP
jgi:predicted hydrocarbon binding protein